MAKTSGTTGNDIRMALQLQCFEAGSLFNNVYVVSCEDTGEGMIIDPAGRAGRVLEYVRERGLSIKYIVYTHAHPDHVLRAAECAGETGAEVVGHRLAAKIMNGLLMRAMSGFGLAFKPVPPTMAVDDGDTLSVGRLGFRVLHTPGHSPDSICLYGGGALFTGDLLFAGSVGRTDIPGGSHKKLAQSIREKILPLPDETPVWPGHGPGTTIAVERRANPFFRQ